MYVYVHMWGAEMCLCGVCVCVASQRSMVRSLSHLVATLVFETKPLTELGAHWFGETVCQSSPGTLPPYSPAPSLVFLCWYWDEFRFPGWHGKCIIGWVISPAPSFVKKKKREGVQKHFQRFINDETISSMSPVSTSSVFCRTEQVGRIILGTCVVTHTHNPNIFGGG